MIRRVVTQMAAPRWRLAPARVDTTTVNLSYGILVHQCRLSLLYGYRPAYQIAARTSRGLSRDRAPFRHPRAVLSWYSA